MNRSIFFLCVIFSCIVYSKCTPTKRSTSLSDKYTGNDLIFYYKDDKCWKVLRDWSPETISFLSLKSQCLLVHQNHDCAGPSQPIYRVHNGSTANVTFIKCRDIAVPTADRRPHTNNRLNTFDVELLSTVAEEKSLQNVIISPASIKSILALLVEASSGDTEILRALQLRAEDREGSLTLLRQLQSHLSNKTSSVELDSRNKIYIENDVKIIEGYRTTIRTHYGANIESVDFLNPARACSVINNWVNEATRGLIPTVVEEDQISRNTKLLLINYVYFKAKWDMEFNRSLTSEDCFNRPLTGCQRVQFMQRKRQLNYTDSDQFESEIFEIPFKDPRYTIVFMLPHNGVGVYDVLKNLKRKNMLEVLKQMKEKTINLRIPRTAVEFSSDKMIESLKKLNIKSIFEKNAKLDRMLPKSSGWSVSEVIHKARIEMNEDGAQAAAVTGGNIEFLSLHIENNLIVNRPYLFFLRDTTVPDFLFEGVVFSPEKAA